MDNRSWCYPNDFFGTQPLPKHSSIRVYGQGLEDATLDKNDTGWWPEAWIIKLCFQLRTPLLGGGPPPQMVSLGQSLDSIGFEMVSRFFDVFVSNLPVYHIIWFVASNPNLTRINLSRAEDGRNIWMNSLVPRLKVRHSLPVFVKEQFPDGHSIAPVPKQAARLSFSPYETHVTGLYHIPALSLWFLGCRRVLSKGWVKADAYVSHGVCAWCNPNKSGWSNRCWHGFVQE
jgi:hypothetical protein